MFTWNGLILKNSSVHYLLLSPVLPTITGQCSGEWSANTGDYTAIWSYDDESDEISFTLEAAVAQDEWMAIGINTLPQMVNTLSSLVTRKPVFGSVRSACLRYYII